MTAEQERGAVVAWLRERAERALEKPSPQYWVEAAWQTRQLGFHDGLTLAADAIERGDHTRDKEGQGHE